MLTCDVCGREVLGERCHVLPANDLEPGDEIVICNYCAEFVAMEYAAAKAKKEEA